MLTGEQTLKSTSMERKNKHSSSQMSSTLMHGGINMQEEQQLFMRGTQGKDSEVKTVIA